MHIEKLNQLRKDHEEVKALCESERYQGWTNRETWATNLWLTKDEELYNEYKGQSARDIKRGLTMLFASNGGYIEGRLLSMITDIGSLWRVNFEEVAESLK